MTIHTDDALPKGHPILDAAAEAVLKRHDKAGFQTIPDVCVVCRQPWPCDAYSLATEVAAQARTIRVLTEALEAIRTMPRRPGYANTWLGRYIDCREIAESALAVAADLKGADDDE